MIPVLLVLLPWAVATVAALLPRRAVQEACLAGGAALHLAGTALAWNAPAGTGADLLGPDPTGLLVLSVVSLVYAACAFYSIGYLRFQRAHRPERPLRFFVPCLFGALGSLTLACLARHMGLLWIALESAGLCVAPLVYFLRTRLALEATWKYLVLSAVGVAFGLLGTFFTALSSVGRTGVVPTLFWPDLVAAGSALSGPWLQAGFALIVLGYGTKVGFAPLHTWKPDTYGEAPAPVSALLAGASPLCFLLGILRLHGVLLAAGHGEFAQHVLLAMGVVSVAVGAALVVRQSDYKRLLAYSSVEHMGVLALGFGVGGVAVSAALLHAVGNGLAKTLLFLSLGNVHRDTGTRQIPDAGGTLARLPATGALLLVGWAAAVGLPPFPLFQSEVGLLRGMFDSGQGVLAAFLLVALAISFAGLSAGLLGVVFGAPPPDRPRPARRVALFVVPSAVLALLLVGLGVFLPEVFSDALRSASASLGGPP